MNRDFVMIRHLADNEKKVHAIRKAGGRKEKKRKGRKEISVVFL